MSDQVTIIREKLAGLEQQLIQSQPNISGLLREIHTALKRDPDVVTILSEEECAVLVNGLKKQTATTISTKAMKSQPKKSMKNMTVDDL